MRAYCIFVTAAALALVAVVQSQAAAGTTSPLSSVAALPAPAALAIPEAPQTIPGLTMKTKNGSWYDLQASIGRGYCLASKGFSYRWAGTYGASNRSPVEDLDLERLVEKDGVATFERTRVHLDPPNGTITVTGRSHVALKEVARTPAGVVVWAFRDERAIVVLARGVDHGVESHQIGTEESGTPFLSSEGCPFAGARLDASKPDAGALAQLAGALPPQGTGTDRVIPRFLVDVSLSRVARDPEPLLAVRVRMRD